MPGMAEISLLNALVVDHEVYDRESISWGRRAMRHASYYLRFDGNAAGILLILPIGVRRQTGRELHWD